MSFRLSALAWLACVSLALGAGCGRTKCEPDCVEDAPSGGAGGEGQGGQAGGGGQGGGGAVAACPPPASTTCVQPAPSFAAAITPLLDRSCNTCHSDNNPDGIWPLHARGDVAAWSQLIIADLVACSMPPPESAAPFPESDRQALFAWLACGSPDN